MLQKRAVTNVRKSEHIVSLNAMSTLSIINFEVRITRKLQVFEKVSSIKKLFYNQNIRILTGTKNRLTYFLMILIGTWQARKEETRTLISTAKYIRSLLDSALWSLFMTKIIK